VNVESDTGFDVVFWVVDPLTNHPLLASLPGLPSGFSTVARNADHALDFVKAPLFDFSRGRVLPPSGNASSDDLQDLLSLFLNQCKDAGGEVYAFGAKFDQNLHKPIDIEFGNTDGLHGIHDIHLNQGNVGNHSGDNEVFHDGGLVLAFPDRFLGLFIGFQTQRIPTDAAGNASPGAKAISQILGGGPQPLPIPTPTPTPTPGPTPPPVARPIVYIDKNARVTPVNTTIGAGESVLLPLDGNGVQLGNQGGTLSLQDDHNIQVDVVTYTADDASLEDRYVRFRR
jgi:uncharacterized protein YukJ